MTKLSRSIGMEWMDGEDREDEDDFGCSPVLNGFITTSSERGREIGKVGRKMAMLNKCPLPASADQKGKKEEKRKENTTAEQIRSEKDADKERAVWCVCAAVAAL